ncbi:MAG: DUF2029 domain-containing protein [Muribaculaceae bacterium]|nr:DUF2029 domain-containing protein [Muribaculaceae bacterium]
MGNNFIQQFRQFWAKPRNVFWLGFIVTIAAASIEVLRGRAENFVDFCDATQNFWNGISSYTDSYVQAHGRYFIYSPVFNVLFAPFAYLPRLLGAYAWDLMNYSMLMLAICHLPAHFQKHKAAIMGFLLLIVGQSVFCFQYNLTVAWVFLWAYILLEKDKGFWAVMLIMLSATTKIYGAAELALLLCYPRMWRNFGYAIGWGVFFVLLPAIKTGVPDLFTWYADWFHQLADHHESTGLYPNIIFLPPFDRWFLPNMRLVQLVGLAILSGLFFWRKSRWHDFDFRTQVTGVLMGYVVLFSEAAETHTYVIALAGYMLCWHTWDKHTTFDRILYWANIIFMGIMPIDMFCPTKIHNFVNGVLYIDVYVYVFMYATMVYRAVASGKRKEIAE